MRHEEQGVHTYKISAVKSKGMVQPERKIHEETIIINSILGRNEG
jgi:hypothetical protein